MKLTAHSKNNLPLRHALDLAIKTGSHEIVGTLF